MEESTSQLPAIHQMDRVSKESSSIYENIFPMRFAMMTIGGIVFAVGLGMFIGGFAGLVADMDVKIRRTGAPNIGYLLLLIFSVVVMVGGGVGVFCGCGAIRHNQRQNEIREGKTKRKESNTIEKRKPLMPTDGTVRSSDGPNGDDVTYTVTYQYRGPPPAEINGIPAYPAPPPDVPPTLKIDPRASVGHQKRISTEPQPHRQQPRPSTRPHRPPMEPRREDALALANIPRKLVLVKRI